MHFKKLAFTAIAASLLIGCDSGPRVEIEAGSKITAKIYHLGDTVMGSIQVVQTGMKGIERFDIPTQNALKKLNCTLAAPTTWDAERKGFVITKASVSCDDKDIVEFPAVLIGQDGKAGIELDGAAIGSNMVVMARDSFTVK
jgi:hypothetical protein